MYISDICVSFYIAQKQVEKVNRKKLEIAYSKLQKTYKAILTDSLFENFLQL